MAGWIKNHCDDKSNLNWTNTSIVLKEELQKVKTVVFMSFSKTVTLPFWNCLENFCLLVCYQTFGNLSYHAPKQWLTANQQKTHLYVFFRKILIFCLILFNTKTTKLYILISPFPHFWFRSIHNFIRTCNTIQINVVQTGCNKPKRGSGDMYAQTAILDCFVISFSLTSFKKNSHSFMLFANYPIVMLKSWGWNVLIFKSPHQHLKRHNFNHMLPSFPTYFVVILIFSVVVWFIQILTDSSPSCQNGVWRRKNFPNNRVN